MKQLSGSLATKRCGLSYSPPRGVPGDTPVLNTVADGYTPSPQGWAPEAPMTLQAPMRSPENLPPKIGTWAHGIPGTAATCGDMHREEGRVLHHIEIARDGKEITCMTSGRTIEMKISLPGREKIKQALFSEKEKALFLRTGASLHRVDPENAEITASHPFCEKNATGCISFNPEGDLVLSTRNRLFTLDGRFNVKSLVKLDFTPRRHEWLPGGTLLCTDDYWPSTIAVFSKEGRKVLEEGGVRHHSAVMGEDEKVYFVGHTWSVNLFPTDLVRWVPSTGEVTRFRSQGPERAQAIIPLKNGSMLVFEPGDYDNQLSSRHSPPRFIIYDRQGHAESYFSPEGKGYVRQFYLNEEESRAYMVFDALERQERSLYEVNLGDDPVGELIRVIKSSLAARGENPGSARGAASERGAAKKPVRLFTDSSGRSGMVPAILKDGRIVAFFDDSIDLLDRCGREVRQYTTSAELMKDLGPHGVSVNFPCPLGEQSRLEQEQMPFRHDMLATVIHAKARTNSSVYLVQGREDSAPGKADQYARWRELRRLQKAAPCSRVSRQSHRPGTMIPRDAARISRDAPPVL